MQSNGCKLETALRTVQSVLEASGTIVNMRKALVDSEDMARRLKFVSSPTIRVNGRDMHWSFTRLLATHAQKRAGAMGV
jgi:hypothetical protein